MSQRLRIRLLYTLFGLALAAGLLLSSGAIRSLGSSNATSKSSQRMFADVGRFRRGVLASQLSGKDKQLISQLSGDPIAWDSGLIRAIVGSARMRQIVWQDSYHTSALEQRHLFVLDCFVRPVASTPLPPLVVITDDQLNLVAWRLVAPNSLGFQVARLTSSEDRTRHTLTIRTLANWFAGTITYEYEVQEDAIVAIGQPYTGPRSSGAPNRTINGDPPSLTELLEAIRASQADLPEAFRWPRTGVTGKHDGSLFYDPTPPELPLDHNVEPTRWL